MTDNYIIAATERQAQIEAAKAAFFKSGGRIQIKPGAPDNPLPPVRRDRVDPETVLKRRKPPLSRSDRIALRQLAAQL